MTVGSMTVTHLIIYPLKSAQGISVPSALMTPTGLEYDREWAVFDENGIVQVRYINIHVSKFGKFHDTCVLCDRICGTNQN